YNWGSPTLANQGQAFLDAADILQYRNSGRYSTLDSFFHLYGNNNSPVSTYLVNGAVDAYSIGPLMTGAYPPTLNPAVVTANASLPWGGANNPAPVGRPR